MAGDACQLPPSRRFRIPALDVKASFKVLLDAEWQTRWAAEPECFLKRLRPSIGPWESSHRRNRREEVSLTRLRIGHCYDTHAHHLNNSAPKMCSHCNSRLTVSHVLSETDCCDHLKRCMRRFFPPTPLVQLLGKDSVVDIEHILSYLTHIQFNIVYNPTSVV